MTTTNDRPIDKLPRMCATILKGSDNQPILIKRGERGYYPLQPGTDVEAINERLGVTPHQLKAMECGSMFGWNVPGADPDLWEQHEKNKKTDQKKD